MSNFCVVTTINFPTKAIEVLHEKFGKNLIVVGDAKTPKDWNYKDVTYIPFVERENWFQGYDPTNHYARKNIGYLEAMRLGATSITESDDDSYPTDKWLLRSDNIEAYENTEKGWFNVYSVLSDYPIWPRGFSLKNIYIKSQTENKISANRSFIQQFLVDGEPDVDAIWRLVLKKEHFFYVNKSVYLKPYSWCPFNSQATMWFPEAYALMYLPVYSKFRMCDIWRSFIAQRCLWELNSGVTFHSPSEFFQDRNKHDLLEDFEDEVDGYLHNDEIVEILENIQLKTGSENVCENLLNCYQSIVDKEILPEMEIRSLMAWIKKYNEIKER